MIGTSLSGWMERRLRQHEAAEPSSRFSRLANALAMAVVALNEREIPFWPIEEVLKLQNQRVHAVVNHAYETVPFYRRAFDERRLRPEQFETADDLAQLPIIDGADLAEDPMRFVSAPFRERGREVFKTSGSTSGMRKPIFWDYASLLLRAARGERDRVVIARVCEETWRGVIVREFVTNERRHSLARLLGVDTEDHQRLLILPADFSSRTQRVIWNERSGLPRKPVHYHHLPPTVPFAVAAAHIKAIRPRLVLSFGSYADQFFRFLDSSGIRIPLPRVWMYISDRLSPEGRELAEKQGCSIFSVYGATEAGTIGFQCEERNGFHLNIDLCVVRLVDDHGQTVPPGRPGNIVISALDNRAMALLNYALGDRAVLSLDPCPCGRSLPILARLEGRCSEMVALADGRQLSSLILEAIFSHELRKTIQAQVEQEAPGRLTWNIVPFAGVDRVALRAAILERGRSMLGAGSTITVNYVDNIARTSAGKFLRAVHPPRSQRKLELHVNL